AVVVVAVAVVLAVPAVVLTRSTDDPEPAGAPAATVTTTDAPSTSGVVDGASSGAAAASVRSVTVAVEGVVGWWDGARFVRAGGGEVPVQGGESYTLVGVGHPPRTARGSGPEDGCSTSDPPGVTVDVGLEPPERGVDARPPIAVSGVTDLVPRPVDALPSHPTYVAVAAAALADLGVEDPGTELRQVVRTDFEGDGRDEVLLVAERVSDPDALLGEPGDHSVVLLRQVVEGNVVTTVVAEATVAGPLDDERTSLPVTRIVAVADLNGDGVMELVTQGRGRDGSRTSVHRVDPRGGVEELLSVACEA
ncbi:MAG: hypothetical protein ACRDYW_08990, partial [Acidimicrobiales bacterium]